MNPDLTSGELAVLVHDRFQGKGLGHKFVEMLIEIAREKGLEDIRGEVLTDNRRMLNLLRLMGFEIHCFPAARAKPG